MADRPSSLADRLGAAATAARGRLSAAVPLAPLAWFRVGGPAEVLFSPADEADLSAFLAALPRDVPVTVVGLASNLIVRDGGIPGVTIRLDARPFASVRTDGTRIVAGAGLADARLARIAADAGLSGLSFLRGVPGAVGGALAMNAGCYGAEVADRLVEARGIDRDGRARVLAAADFAFSYRKARVPEGLVLTEATFEGVPGEREAILAEMAAITKKREESQPVKSRTGGSTFKNPPGARAWELVDRAGCRGLRLGGAQVSDKHANFLENTGGATAADLERLGETVRGRVRAATGVTLEWEIRRIGEHPAGVAVAPFMEAA